MLMSRFNVGHDLANFNTRSCRKHERRHSLLHVHDIFKAFSDTVQCWCVQDWGCMLEILPLVILLGHVDLFTEIGHLSVSKMSQITADCYWTLPYCIKAQNLKTNQVLWSKKVKTQKLTMVTPSENLPIVPRVYKPCVLPSAKAETQILKIALKAKCQGQMPLKSNRSQAAWCVYRV